MIRLRHKLFIYALRIFDQALLVVSLLVCIDQFGKYQETGSLEYLCRNYYDPRAGVGLALLILCWIWIFDTLVNYETNRLKSLRTQILDVIKAYSVSAFVLTVIATVFAFKRIHKELILSFWIASCSLGMLSRVFLRWALMLVRSSGYNYRHLLILGYNEQALRMTQRIDATPVLGYKIIGIISEQPVEIATTQDSGESQRIIGHIKDLKGILEKGPVDEIMICLPLLSHFDTVSAVVRLAQELGVVVRLFPDTETTKILARCNIEQFEGHCVVTFFREQLLLQLFGKRMMDLLVSLVLLVLLSPLLLVVALGIKLTSPGPILFVQPRVGMNKRSFKLYKFRSMYMDAEKRRKELAHLNEMDGPVFKIKNDPRVTPLGRFIRKMSIDELPQLVNVVTGHMSLVGPRPPLLDEVDRYDWLYRKRLSIKPGITCLWQISGRNEVTFRQWMEMDQFYVDNWSLWLDIKILAKTVPAVLFRRGAS
jgi:exopolysaccharide biosynthesis polyprenyl glycosylphosphotransferase